VYSGQDFIVRQRDQIGRFINILATSESLFGPNWAKVFWENIGQLNSAIFQKLWRFFLVTLTLTQVTLTQ